MARAPVLSSSTLSPFGGGGGGFGAFSVVNPGREAYLVFTRAENAWQNGELSNADYLAALGVYVAAQTVGTAAESNAQQKLFETTYRVNRNVLVAEINAGTKDPTDLLEYDRQALVGLNHDSQTYQDRLGTFESTQQRVFSDAEQVMIDHYQAGTITTTQLQQWYKDQAPAYVANHDLADTIAKRVDDLNQRVQDERDSQAVTDYNDGRMGDDAFLAYATTARARYATGTSQATDWDKRIATAQTAKAEDGLLYRYGLSQQYAQLQQFIASNAGKPAGGTSSSTSTRTLLGADGQWHTVATTSTKATAPTAAEQAAYRDLQVQIADARSQMTAISTQLATAPDTQGFVSTDAVISYYSSRLAGLTRGSSDWYAIQGKIDSLTERKHAEAVLAQQGLKITYPSGGATVSAGSAARTTSSGGGTTPRVAASSAATIDTFMAAVAKQESGGRYDARNATTGAFGKYQIMPSNWSAWAAKYLGNAAAAQTPDNQEKVVKGKMADLYTWLGSWDAVAYWWLNGGTKAAATNPANWSKSAKGYVDAVMGTLGVATSPSPTVAPVRGALGGLSTVVAVGRPLTKTGRENVTIAGASFPVNLDGAAFTKFYSAYEAAFKSGAESFVDSSSGKAVAYFIGSDAADRIDRMRQLDDLRIGLFTEKASAYAGTPSEITASGQLNGAYQDAASHEYQILDTLIQTKQGAKGSLAAGPQGPASQAVNPIAAGIRVLDQLEAGVKAEVAAAQEAYGRGDVSAAYAHLQLARSLTSTSLISSGPSKGTPIGNVVNIAKYATAAQQAVAAIQSYYGGVEPDKKVTDDLARLAAFGTEIDALSSRGSELDALTTTIRGQIKVDGQGNALIDAAGQVTLADGWARFADAGGKVTIERSNVAEINPSTGKADTTLPGYTKALIRVGSTIEDVYAKWTAGTVGYIRNPGGQNIPIKGKITTMVVDGKPQTFYEDPLHPGSWSDAAVVYNAPSGLSTVQNSDGSVTPTFTVAASPKGGLGNLAGATLSLQFDAKTGTYLIIANKTGGLFSAPITNLAVGSAGDQNVLDLLNVTGFTRDASTASTGFSNVGVPVFGMSPEQYAAHLNPVSPISAYRNNPTAIAAGLSLEARDEAYAKFIAGATTTLPSAPPPPAQRPDATLTGTLPRLSGLPPGKAIDDLASAAPLPKIPQAAPPPLAQRPDATLSARELAGTLPSLAAPTTPSLPAATAPAPAPAIPKTTTLPKLAPLTKKVAPGVFVE